MDSQNFRDKISTVTEDGKRIWVYPKMPKGIYYNWRKIVSYVLLLFLFAAPHIQYKEEPLLLFNIIKRKFIIFGHIFWPQDFFIFAIAMIGGLVLIALFTVIYGRIFCGWMCPQTIFMEFIYRRIEYFIEGDRMKQIKLNKSPWTTEKILKKSIKHILFFGIAFLISNTFLAYIIGAEELWKIQWDNPASHVSGLMAIFVFSGLFYGVFAFLREQVCTTICPYGRLQGVLLDKNSIVVGYDYLRGEGENGRHKVHKKEDRKVLGYGDCIDCHQCVHVCPTGIDIRHGTQLECVNCTACMDECDNIMDKVGFDKGLIRYDSEEGIKTGIGFKWNTRNLSYTIVMLVIFGILTSFLLQRSDFQATITRSAGTTQRTLDDDKIANFYDLSVFNKTREDYDITMILEDEYDGEVKVVGDAIHLVKESLVHGKFVVILDKSNIKKGKNVIYVKLFGNGKLIERKKIVFLGPLF